MKLFTARTLEKRLPCTAVLRIKFGLPREAGFTLIELLIVMAISVMLLAGIYGAYRGHLSTTLAQQHMVEMNQNLRTAVLIMGRDIRMAGVDPSGNAGAGFVTATRSLMEISMDYQSTHAGTKNKPWYDGSISTSGEVVRFDLSTTGELRRRVNAEGKNSLTTGITRHLARNIDAVDFVYLDADGTVLNSDARGMVSDDNRTKIRSVQVTLVARAAASAPVLARKHTDRTIYYNAQGSVILDKSASPDSFRRQMISLTLNCRNMGT
ncbi:prepilin-type N-terminal cleavage/methylation domain-containing protein [Desulfosarcina sp. OttesenSCG-928-A07]|nr:prepilin-type N-terminal cleavage/methylation domain-containing protein [Desulfosarcina sp. OttesenSCG-928-A07]